MTAAWHREVRHDPAAAEDGRVEFLLAFGVGADGGDELARTHVGSRDDDGAGGRAGDADVAGGKCDAAMLPAGSMSNPVSALISVMNDASCAGIPVMGEHAPQAPHLHHGAQVGPALVAAAADEQGRRIRQGEQARGERARRGRAKRRDLD